MELIEINQPAYFLKLEDESNVSEELFEVAMELNEEKSSNVIVTNKDYNKIVDYYKSRKHIKTFDDSKKDGKIVSVFESVWGTLNIVTFK